MPTANFKHVFHPHSYELFNVRDILIGNRFRVVQFYNLCNNDQKLSICGASTRNLEFNYST